MMILVLSWNIGFLQSSLHFDYHTIVAWVDQVQILVLQAIYYQDCVRVRLRMTTVAFVYIYAQLVLFVTTCAHDDV